MRKMCAACNVCAMHAVLMQAMLNGAQPFMLGKEERKLAQSIYKQVHGSSTHIQYSL